MTALVGKSDTGLIYFYKVPDLDLPLNDEPSFPAKFERPPYIWSYEELGLGKRLLTAWATPLTTFYPSIFTFWMVMF